MAAPGGPGGGAQLDAHITQINNTLQQLQGLPAAVQQLQGDVQQLQADVQQLQGLPAAVQQLQGQLALLVPAAGGGPVPVAALPPGYAGLPAAVAALAGMPAALAALQAAVAALAPAAGAAGGGAAAAAAPGAPQQLTVRQRIAVARSANRHNDSDDVFVPVPLANGATPPHWPNNFSRRILRDMTQADPQDLLGDYNKSINGSLWHLRNRIAKHIGAFRF